MCAVLPGLLVFVCLFYLFLFVFLCGKQLRVQRGEIGEVGETAQAAHTGKCDQQPKVFLGYLV